MAVSAAALLAFAAPASAEVEGPFWYQNEEKIGDQGYGEPVDVTITGDLKWRAGPWVFQCTVSDGETQLFNDGIASHGRSQGVGITFSSCNIVWSYMGQYYVFPKCYAYEASMNGTQGFNLSEPQDVVWNTDVWLLFSKACQSESSIEQSVYLYGTLTGEWRNPGEDDEGCIVYDEAGSLEFAPSAPTKTNGKLCLSTEAEDEISVHSEGE